MTQEQGYINLPVEWHVRGVGFSYPLIVTTVLDTYAGTKNTGYVRGNGTVGIGDS